MKRALYVILPLLLALALRLYPTLISGQPFSTDAWSPIRNTELLIQNTPISLSSNIFDCYNNFWPANSIFGAIISQVTFLKPTNAMALFFPIIGATAILILFALVKRLYNIKVAAAASTIFGTIFTHTYFTAGVTKETYASPIYILLILLFLHPTIGKNRQILLFTITSITLALTHHFTALIAAFIISSIALGKIVNNTKTGVSTSKSDFLLILIPIATSLLYYGLFAQAGMANPLTTSEWISLASYQLLAFATAIYIVYKPITFNKTTTLLIATTSAATVVTFILLSLNAIMVPGYTISMQQQVLLYLTPYFLALPFIAIGFEQPKSTKPIIAPLFWIAPLIALEVYALLSNTFTGTGLWIRTPNFLLAPAAILCAAGLYYTTKKAKGIHLKRLIKPAVLTVIAAIVIVNIYSLYASVNLQDRYMGYQWLFNTQEFQAATWVNTTITNQTIAGDIKVFYLIHDYFATNVDSTQGYQYLASETQTQPQILITYSQMQKNGYLLGIHGLDLPANWTQNTAQMNFAYTNGYTNIHTGVEAP
jgi:hypothetical protein